MTRFDGLPGADLVRAGLADLAQGKRTIEALLVAVGGPRLRDLGLEVPRVEQPEHALYAALSRLHGDDAHGRYNALVRRLVSFERALESARSRSA